MQRPPCTKSILKCWKRSVKRKSNLSFISHKNLSFDQCFLYVYGYVKPFLKLFGDNFLFPAQSISCVSSATLLCKTKYFDYVSVSTEYTVANCIIQIAFCQRSLWLLVCWVHYQDLKCLAEHNFFTLKFHCFMLLLNSITFNYTFFSRII